jgi:hypothetical protein
MAAGVTAAVSVPQTVQALMHVIGSHELQGTLLATAKTI